MSAANQIDDLTRKLLREKLGMVTEANRDFFTRMWRPRYPSGDIVAQMSASHLRSSIDLLDRTLSELSK